MALQIYFTNGSEVVAFLEDFKKLKGIERKLRVYVMFYKDRTKEETEKLIKSCDLCVDYSAWKLIDDTSKYEFINK